MFEIPEEEIKLAKDVFKSTLRDPKNFELFIADCRRLGISPLEKKLHPQERSGRYTPVTSIDYMRLRAEATGNYAGQDDAKFEWEENNAYPVQATVTVYKILGHHIGKFTATARWDEYYPGDGVSGQMWRKFPTLMLGKCAEALALRKGFPGSMAGLYVKEEMDQADKPTKAEKATAGISREQANVLAENAKAEGWARGDLLAFLMKHFGVNRWTDIPVDRFDQVLEEICKGPNKELFPVDPEVEG